MYYSRSLAFSSMDPENLRKIILLVVLDNKTWRWGLRFSRHAGIYGSGGISTSADNLHKRNLVKASNYIYLSKYCRVHTKKIVHMISKLSHNCKIGSPDPDEVAVESSTYYISGPTKLFTAPYYYQEGSLVDSFSSSLGNLIRENFRFGQPAMASMTNTVTTNTTEAAPLEPQARHVIYCNGNSR